VNAAEPWSSRTEGPDFEYTRHAGALLGRLSPDKETLSPPQFPIWEGHRRSLVHCPANCCHTSDHRATAIHDQIVASHIRTRVGAKEQDGTLILVLLGHTPHWN
jgi:hypothetical protein